MSPALSSPSAAVAEMMAAGAIFAAHDEGDGLGPRFTFSVAPGGDLARCREILADAKARPAAFFDAFRCEVHAVVRAAGASR